MLRLILRHSAVVEDEKFDPVSITDENIAEKESPVMMPEIK